MNCCIVSLFIRNTFEGILKSQLIRFLTICNNLEDFHKRRQFFLKCSVKNYVTQADFLDRLKGNSWEIIGAIWPSLSPCTVINPKLLTYLRNYQLPGITYDPIGDALKCKSRRYQCCLYLDEKSHFSEWWWLWFSRIYWIRFLFEKYVGEAGRCLKDRMYNHIRYQ